MAQSPAERKRAQRARDRARLGDKECKRVEAEKMKKWRASKRPPKPKKTTIINNQPPPQPRMTAHILHSYLRCVNRRGMAVHCEVLLIFSQG